MRPISVPKTVYLTVSRADARFRRQIFKSPAVGSPNLESVRVGKVRIAAVKKVSRELIARYPDKFTTNYESNKTVLADLVDAKTKRLRNRVVGYVTRAVLDGTHRLAALSQLGCKTIPTALIDYQSPLVKVDRWFRVITGEKLGAFMKRVKDRTTPLSIPASQSDPSLLSRLNYAT